MMRKRVQALVLATAIVAGYAGAAAFSACGLPAVPVATGFGPDDGLTRFVLTSSSGTASDELIAALEARGLPYLLATNNSTATPAEYVTRMAGYGVAVTEAHIQTSATATRDFLKRELPEGACLLVDDVRFSGWTLAMTAGQLRRRGAPAVFPLALATAF